MQAKISLSQTLARRDLFGAFAFAVAAISGKLSAAKLLGTVLAPWLLEARLWMTIAAVILLLPFARSVRWNRGNAYTFGSIIVLTAYLIVRAPFGATDLTAMKVLDLIYLAVLCYLALIVASDTARLMVCGATILTASGILFLLALTGVATNPELNGAGWAAIGGPLTFYRLEFLGFSCTLWMLLRNKCHPAIGIILLGVFLFATLASLSKAAYGATTIVLLVLAAGLIAQRNWQTLATLIVAALVALAAWNTFLSSSFYLRAISAFASQQTGPTEVDLAEIEKHYQLVFPSDPRPTTAPDRPTTVPDRPTTVPDRHQLSKDFLAPGFSFSTEFRWCVLDDPVGTEKAMVTCYKRTMIDKTQRLFFLFKALENPTLFGHGIANFRVLALNPTAGYRLEQYTYPHNVVVEVLYDAGIIGLGLLIVALMCSVAFSGCEPSSLALGGFALFIFVSALAGGDFYDFRLFWLAALIASTPDWGTPGNVSIAKPDEQRSGVTI